MTLYEAEKKKREGVTISCKIISFLAYADIDSPQEEYSCCNFYKTQKLFSNCKGWKLTSSGCNLKQDAMEEEVPTDNWVPVSNHHYIKEMCKDYFNAGLFLRVSVVGGMEATAPGSPQYPSFMHFFSVGNICVCRVQRIGNGGKPNFLLTRGFSFSVLTVPFWGTKPQSTLVCCVLEVTLRCLVGKQSPSLLCQKNCHFNSRFIQNEMWCGLLSSR